MHEMTDDIASSSTPEPLPRRTTPPAVSLVGFMGAGKTTVGRALADRLGWRFEDLDDLIQTSEGCSVEQIFRLRGELAFRDIEHDTLRQAIARIEDAGCDGTIVNSSRVVLGLGGGTFVDCRNQEILRHAGIPAIFLNASAEELFRRSESEELVRPLRHDFQNFYDLYERRRLSYIKAAYSISTMGKDVATVVTEIISELNLIP